MVDIETGSWEGVRLTEPIIIAGDKFKPVTIPLAKAERIPEVISKAFPVTAEELKRVEQELLAKAALIPPAPLAEEPAPTPEPPEEEPPPPIVEPAPTPALPPAPPPANIQVHPGAIENFVDGVFHLQVIRHQFARNDTRQIYQVPSGKKFQLCTCALNGKFEAADFAYLQVVDAAFRMEYIILNLGTLEPQSVWGGLSFFPPITIPATWRIEIRSNRRGANAFIHGWIENA